MEDSHLAEVLPQEPGTSLFAVFDGHGGAEVAKFCQVHLPAELARLRAEGEGDDVGASLVKVFHRMDDMLRESKCVVERGGGAALLWVWVGS